MLNPKALKGSKVVTGNGIIFIVAGGNKDKKGNWFLKDDSGTFFPLQDCLVIDDIKEAIATCKTPNDYASIIQLYGQNVAEAAWADLEQESPALMAAISVAMYADSWSAFVAISHGYGVSKEQKPELNQQFRDQLKSIGVSKQVAQWYQQQQPKQLNLIS